VEMVQLLPFDHQSTGWLIGLARTLEEFFLVENMLAPDTLLLLLS
jgi:hypothetical protein